MSACTGCGGAVHGARLCTRCGKQLGEALGQVTWLVVQLDILLTRQTRTGERAGGRSSTAPLPYDPRASAAASRMSETLTRWAKRLGSDGALRGYYTAGGLAAYLICHMDRLRQLEDAGRARIELMEAIGKAEQLIDLPPELWYAGPCDECGQDAYARPGAGVVTCRCGWQVDVQLRRDWLLKEAEATLAHAELIARGLSRLGKQVTRNMIVGYAFRGRLMNHGKDRKGRVLYRIGDVLDIVTAGE